jgi:type IX secretion system PorP/SprF family membrane protein
MFRYLNKSNIMMRALQILFILLLLHNETAAQEDIHFAQFYELPVLRNPALAGIFNGNVRFTTAYRNQWQSVTTPYRTMALGAEVKIFKGFTAGDFITTGMQVTNDVAGDSKLKRAQFLPFLNYHKLLNEDNSTLLNLAFMGGLVTEGFDPSQLKFDDQFMNGSYSSSNPTNQNFTNTGFNYFDFSTGISFSSFVSDATKIYAGAAMFHITQPSLSFIKDNEVRLNRKYGFNAGLSTQLNSYAKLVFYADYFVQSGSRLAQAGILYTYNLDAVSEGSIWSLTGGAVYRLNDAFIPVIKLNSDKLSIGMSYDLNISKLKTASTYRGGFELTFSYTGLWKLINDDAAAVQCPRNIW